MIVKDILYRNKDIDYGLNIIFKLDDNKFLLFDSIGFSFVEEINLMDNRWKHSLHWGNKLRIDGIYEDELTAYFLPSDSDYKDIVSYMNEEWIDVWYSKAGSINNIIFSLGDKTCK